MSKKDEERAWDLANENRLQDAILVTGEVVATRLIRDPNRLPWEQLDPEAKAKRILSVIKEASHTDISASIDGQYRTFEADWLKDILEEALKPTKRELEVACEQLRQGHDAMMAGQYKLADSCLKTAGVIIENIVRKPEVCKLSGVELHAKLIKEGKPLCSECKGYGNYFDETERDSKTCDICSGSGEYQLH